MTVSASPAPSPARTVDGDDLSFLAPPDHVADWRMVLTYTAAVDAGLLYILPASADELAARTQLHPRAIRVVLDALGDWSIVDRDGSGRYRLGPGAPDADDAATLWHHARAIRQWTALGESLQEPVRQRAAAAAAPPDTFQQALAVGARARAPGLVDAIVARVGAIADMLDLGGGHGEYALEFARRGVSAVLQDRAPVIEVARRRGAVGAGGVELFAGDFFETMPSRTFDLVLVAGVTHTFDEDHNRRLLQQVRTVLRPGGRLAIVTLLQRRTPAAALFAVQMLANGGGGDTHAEGDYRRWLSDAGFGEVEITDIGATSQSLITARFTGA